MESFLSIWVSQSPLSWCLFHYLTLFWIRKLFLFPQAPTKFQNPVINYSRLGLFATFPNTFQNYSWRLMKKGHYNFIWNSVNIDGILHHVSSLLTIFILAIQMWTKKFQYRVNSTCTKMSIEYEQNFREPFEVYVFILILFKISTSHRSWSLDWRKHM